MLRLLRHAAVRFDALVSTAILFREAIRSSRRWQTYASRTLFSGVLIGMLLIGINAAVTASTNDLIDSAELGGIGRYVFVAFSVAQLALATVFAPMSSATAVIEEADERTLDLLMLTRLQAGQILAAKVLSRILVLLTMVLGAMPVMMLVVALGGVSGLEVVAVTVHTLTTVVLMGCLGAFFALQTRSPMLCVMASGTYAIPFFVLFAGAYGLASADPYATAHFSPFAGSQARDLGALLPPLSYLPSLVVIWRIMVPMFQLRASRASYKEAFSAKLWGTARWTKHVGLWFLASITLIAAIPAAWADNATGTHPLTVQVVARLGEAWVWVMGSWAAALCTWAFLRIAFDVVDGLDALFHGVSDAQRDAIRIGRNPIWWRETRRGASGAGPILATWAIVVMAFGQTGWWLVPGGILAAGIANGAAALILSIWLGTRAFTAERRNHTLEVLLTTTLPARQLVTGKLGAVLLPTGPIMLASLPLLALGVPHLRLIELLGDKAWKMAWLLQGTLAWLWMLPVWFVVLAVALTMGIRARNPRSAFGLVVAATAIFFAVPAMIGQLFPELPVLSTAARIWAPPLTRGASGLHHLLSALGYTALAMVLFARLSSRLRLWAVRILALLLCGLPAVGQAQQPVDRQKEEELANQLRMRAEPLFDGIVRPDSWTSVRVVIENLGAGTEGALTLEDNDRELGIVRWARQVELPEGAKKEVTLLYRPQGQGREHDLLFVTPTGRAARARIRTQLVPPEGVTVGVIGDDPMGLQALTTASRLGVPGPRVRLPVEQPRPVRVGVWPALALPSHSAAYDSLDQLVWIDADPSRLSDPQARALTHWVADGGHLLITVTDTGRQLAASPVGRLLPGRVEAPREGHVSRFVSRFGAPSNATTPVATFFPGPGATVLERTDEGEPLRVRHAWGAGSVQLLLVSPTLEPLEAVDRVTLWRELLSLPVDGMGTPEDPLLNNGPWTYRMEAPILGDDVRRWLADVPGVAPVPMSWLVGFSVVYLVLIGPLDYLVLRWLRRGPLTWFTYPVTISVFTGIAVVGMRYTKGSQAVLTRVELVDVHPREGLWLGDTWFGVFSTRKVDLTVRSGFDDAVVRPQSTAGFLRSPTLRAGGGPGELAYHAETWTLAYARSTWAHEATGALEIQPDGPDAWLVTNRLGHDLDQLLAADLTGNQVAVGSLAQGATTRFARSELAYGSDERWQLATSLLALTPDDRGELSQSGELVLIGIAEGKTFEPLQLEGLRPVDQSMLVFRQPLEAP